MKLALNGWWRLWIVLSVVYGAAVAAKGWVQELAYTALLQRTIEIGATDLDEGDDARPV
jgi:hypothetical protein